MALVTNASYIIIAVLGILQAMAGVMTIGNVQAMVQYVWQVNQPISTITQLSAIIQSATSSIQRVFDLLDQEEEVQGAVKASLPKEIRGDVTFENVSFSYDKENPLIKNFNLDKYCTWHSVRSCMYAKLLVGPAAAGQATERKTNAAKVAFI